MRSKKTALFLVVLLFIGMFVLTLNATPVGRAQASKTVYVVNMVDAEMWGVEGWLGHEAYVYPYSSPYWNYPNPPIDMRCYAISPPFTVSQVMDDSFRDSHRDSFGTPFKITWFAEMDYLMEQGVFEYADGSPAGVSGYTAVMDILLENWRVQIEAYGDAIEYHHHFMSYDDVNGWQPYNNGPDAGYGDYQMYALDKMILDGNFFPVTWDSGWGIMPDVLSDWVDEWFPFDYTSTQSTTYWYPIHPLKSGGSSCTRWAQQTDIYPDVPSWEGINAAFETAESRGNAIYCFAIHDREDMLGATTDAHDMLVYASSIYPDVSFQYVTAAEAMQLSLGWTDFTKPTFTISPSGDSYIITASEPLWANHPYVALEYSDGTYTHMETVNSGTNTWTITPPSPSSLVKIGVAGSDLYGNPGVLVASVPIATAFFTVPLSGWVVDARYTNAAYTLDSSASSLFLELNTVSPSSKVTIYNLDFPPVSLSDYDYVDVSVTGTPNAKILLRFFLDDGTSFNVVYWSNADTLDATMFDLTPYAGRTISSVYVALMSSDETLASVDFSEISLKAADGSFDLTVTASTNGATSPGPGVYSYDEGSDASVTANPNADYQLCHWELDGVMVGGNPCVVSMDGDHSLSAVFIPENLVSLTCWQIDESLTNAPYTLSYSSLHLELDADDTADKVAIYRRDVPTVTLSSYDHIDVSVTGTANAKILLRFFMDNGNSFDVVYWKDPTTLNAISFDLSAYAERTLTSVYIALMSSDGAPVSIDVTGIELVAAAPPPEVPLAGWVVKSALTNAPYTLSSTASVLSLDLDASDISSKVTVYSLGVPTLNLGDYSHVDVSVTGTANAKILLRFFMDNGNSFDVVYWKDPTTLNAISFDLSPYAERTLRGDAYIALMSSDGLDASIDITDIALITAPPSPNIPLMGWAEVPSLTNAAYTLDSTESLLSLDLDAVDVNSKVVIKQLAVPALSLADYSHVDVAASGTSNAKILLRFFMDNGNSFDVVYWKDPTTLNAISFDLSPYAERTLRGDAYIALMSSDGLDASIDITEITLVV